MSDISIIEFIVWGFIAYSGLLMLIISSVRDTPNTKSGSIARAIYLLPSGIAALFLAFSGETIIIQDVTNTIVAVNTSEVFTETISMNINLQNSLWVTIHFLIFFVIMWYVFVQVLDLLTKRD